VSRNPPSMYPPARYEDPSAGGILVGIYRSVASGRVCVGRRRMGVNVSRWGSSITGLADSGADYGSEKQASHERACRINRAFVMVAVTGVTKGRIGCR